MDIHAVSGAATVALACAAVFLAAARSWQLLAEMLAGTPDFADSITSEAAQRFRDELGRLTRAQAAWLGAALVFVVIYCMAMQLRQPRLFDGYPEWQLWLLLATLAIAAMMASWHLARTILSLQSVRLLRDANVAIGQQLQHMAAEHGHAYHDVRFAAGIVDHVLLGRGGVYAISVIARKAATGGTVRCDGSVLRFAGAGDACDIGATIAACDRVAQELGSLVGRPVPVACVIAVPGWDIQEACGGGWHLVNEKSIQALPGRSEPCEPLTDEELRIIEQDVARRSARPG